MCPCLTVFGEKAVTLQSIRKQRHDAERDCRGHQDCGADAQAGWTYSLSDGHDLGHRTRHGASLQRVRLSSDELNSFSGQQ